MSARRTVSLSAIALAACLAGACGKAATTPPATAELPAGRDAGPEPDAREELDAADARAAEAARDPDAALDAATPLASPRDAAADASPPARTGPVEDEADAVERASRAADAALDKAYAAFVKKVHVAPSHTGSWARAAHRSVRGGRAIGWEVTFESHVPAGFEYEAVVHVSPRGVLTVRKANASYAPD